MDCSIIRIVRKKYASIKDYKVHHQPRKRLAGQVLAGNRQGGAHHGRGGGGTRPANQERRPGSARKAHQSQSALRGVRGQTIPESGTEPPGPDQRGQPRTDQGRREVRRDPRFQVHLLRRVVDSPVDPSSVGRTVAHRASAAQSGRIAQQDQQGVRTLRAGARTHAVARRTGRNWNCRARR